MSDNTANAHATFSVGVSVTATATLALPLWSQWAIAAVEQRDASRQARTELTRDRDDPTWYLASQREMRASMQSIVAAAFAIEGWGFASRGADHVEGRWRGGPDHRLAIAGPKLVVNRAR